MREAASSIKTRLPQLLTRALFLAKITSSSRTKVGWQFTVIVVFCEAVLPASSVTVRVAVTLLLCPCAPPSKVKDEASKVAFGLLPLLTLPSLTVHLYVKLPPQAEDWAAPARFDE